MVSIKKLLYLLQHDTLFTCVRCPTTEANESHVEGRRAAASTHVLYLLRLLFGLVYWEL